MRIALVKRNNQLLRVKACLETFYSGFIEVYYKIRHMSCCAKR
jgi:hypothetical protein